MEYLYITFKSKLSLNKSNWELHSVYEILQYKTLNGN